MRYWIGTVLAGCLALPAMAQTATLALPGGQEVVLPAGALSGVSNLATPGLRLLLNEVTDQRCPSAYDCYWEGLIRAVILVNADAHGAQYRAVQYVRGWEARGRGGGLSVDAGPAGAGGCGD